jgi:hypothetical protein
MPKLGVFIYKDRSVRLPYTEEIRDRLRFYNILLLDGAASDFQSLVDVGDAMELQTEDGQIRQLTVRQFFPFEAVSAL